MWYRAWSLLKKKRLISVRTMDNGFFIKKKRVVCRVDTAINLFNVLCSFKRYCLFVPDTALPTGDMVVNKAQIILPS